MAYGLGLGAALRNADATLAGGISIEEQSSRSGKSGETEQTSKEVPSQHIGL